tara:strand:+ start:350 stop:1621 length:1272 start_codon:yes stop_codon:yes gene_type:complete
MNDKKVMLIRYLGIFIAGITALLSLKVFLSYEPQNAATLLAILGWLLFTDLLMFGYGRPCYAIVRKNRELGYNINKLVYKFVKIYICQAIFGLVIMAFLSNFLAKQNGYLDSYFDLVIFSMGLISISICNFKRDLSYALNVEVQFEILTTIRRFFLLCIFIALFFGSTLLLTGIFGLMAGFLTFLYMAKIIFNEISSDEDRELKKKEFYIGGDFKKKALQFWGFKISELTFYNIPLIYFTFNPSVIGLAYYAIWIRMWQFFMMPYMIFVDTRINAIISAFYKYMNKETVRGLLICLLISFAILVFCLIIFQFIDNIIYNFIGGTEIVDSYFIISLAIWLTGHVIQHTFGSFIISYGDGFRFSLILSFSSVIFLGFVFISTYQNFENIGLSMVFCGITYFFLSIIYMLKSFLVIRSNRKTVTDN